MPAGAGSYAPEEILLGQSNASLAPDSLIGVTALLETLGAATGASLEVWVLRVSGDPTVAGDWYFYNAGLTAVGGNTYPLASVGAVKLRAKSGGVAGSLIASAWAD